jgi:predicted lysophospholipase L1 biosynthesis ABC-type transport system permease subunit
MRWDEGSDAVPAQLGRDGAIVTRAWADEQDLEVGSPLVLETPTGATLRLRVEGIWKEPKGGSPLGNLTISHAAHAEGFPQPRNDYTFLQIAGGVTPANTAALERALQAFPDAKLETREQFKDAQVARLAQALNILYVLLALSVIVSLFGIVNTLVLTVFERTRELGMLRAVGMTRGQIRRMIRHESVVTALLGAALGIARGSSSRRSWPRRSTSRGSRSRSRSGRSPPSWPPPCWSGSSRRSCPARRASRLDVLEALQHA